MNAISPSVDVLEAATRSEQGGERSTHCPRSPRNGARALLDALVEAGVDTLFGYPGGAALPLYDALYQEPRLRHVLVRHEQAAVHAAEGYARSTGRVGVVLVTSGPGVANTIAGLLDALSDSVPVLCISGQVATPLIGTGAFQESDALGMSRPVTKWNVQVRDADAIPSTIAQALERARSGRPGPVLVDVPKDVQLALLHEEARSAGGPPAGQEQALPAGAGIAANGRTLSKTDSWSPKELQRAAGLLATARRPVFYGGGGLINSGEAACERFGELVRRLNAPCTLTLMGLGAFPASDARFLGMLGMHGTLEANLAMHEADLVVCVGARFDDRVTGALDRFCPTARKIHIDIDRSSIGKIVKVDTAIVGDCGEALALLLERPELQGLGAGRLAPWWERISGWRAHDCLAFTPRVDAILPQQAIDSLQRALDERSRPAAKGRSVDEGQAREQGSVIVSTDVGQHQMWAAQYLRFDAPRRWLSSGGAGTMGYGLPAAIGAQIAHPEALVVCVSGDASILMNIQELATAMQHRAAVKVVLVNNGCMGMVRQWQQLNHGNRISHSWNEALPDFVQLARSFGWGAESVGDPARLAQALEQCLAYEGPYLLDVRVAAQENCFPMIPAGEGHDRVLLAEGRWYAEEGRAEPGVTAKACPPRSACGFAPSPRG